VVPNKVVKTFKPETCDIIGQLDEFGWNQSQLNILGIPK
jgi:hypothetical protein